MFSFAFIWHIILFFPGYIPTLWTLTPQILPSPRDATAARLFLWVMTRQWERCIRRWRRIAFCVGTIGGVLLGKILCKVTGGKDQPNWSVLQVYPQFLWQPVYPRRLVLNMILPTSCWCMQWDQNVAGISTAVAAGTLWQFSVYKPTFTAPGAVCRPGAYKEDLNYGRDREEASKDRGNRPSWRSSVFTCYQNDYRADAADRRQDG